MNAMTLDVDPFAVRVAVPDSGLRELYDFELDWVNGGSDALAALNTASGVFGAAAFVVGAAALVPGPHSAAFGAAALGLGAVSVSLWGAATLIGAVTE